MIGGYRVDGVLGSGAMGHVYAAHQLSMDRDVALKVLHPQMIGDSNILRRFVREARVVAKLDHPNIVIAFDAGQEEEFYYLAMAKVEGTDLSKLIRERGAIDEQSVLTITLRVAEALHYAWETHKILHRDIKPANIMVDDEMNVKLTDMGISKPMRETKPDIEQTQGIVGTPFYMSPEQADEITGINFHADMYALGATAYHCLTGVRPFEGPNSIIVMAKHLREPLVPPKARNPAVSEAASDLIVRMMAKKPAGRPPTWLDLIDELRYLTGDAGSSAREVDIVAGGMPTIRSLPRIRSRVLLLDSDPQGLILLEQVVPTQYIVASAQSADDGLAAIGFFRPDIIIVDLGMPGVDDRTFLELLRQQRQHNFIRVLAISDDGSPPTRIGAYQQGADDFLAKPYLPEELRLKLSRWGRFTRYEELSQVKDEFLVLVGDEDSSPFQQIMEAVGVVKNDEQLMAKESMRKMMHELEVSGEQFIIRYNLLLDYIFCRGETYPVRVQSVALDKFLNPYLGRWAAVAAEAGLTLDGPAEPPRFNVIADPQALSRVIRWVMHNAFAHGKSSVKLTYGALNDELFHIDVIDDGSGFDATVLPIVFSAFEMGRALFAGTRIGLHLSLAKELLHLQGGDILVVDPGPDSTTVRIVLSIDHEA
jgi:serine/threonine-protein kinase